MTNGEVKPYNIINPEPVQYRTFEIMTVASHDTVSSTRLTLVQFMERRGPRRERERALLLEKDTFDSIKQSWCGLQRTGLKWLSCTGNLLVTRSLRGRHRPNDIEKTILLVGM